MDRETQETIELLRRLRAELPPDGPVTLSEEYLASLERLEQLPRNRAAADKTWVVRSLARSRRLFRSVTRR